MAANKSVKKTTSSKQSNRTTSSSMQSKKKPSKFQIGMVIGGITAAAAALFVAPKLADPKKRKELTKKINSLKKSLAPSNIDQTVKNIFGESTAQTKKIYNQAKEGVTLKIAALKDSETLDSKKYAAIVNQVVDVVKKEYAHESKRVGKLKQQLLEDWKKLDAEKKKTLAKNPAVKKTVTKKTVVKTTVVKKSPAKKRTSSKK